MVSLIIRGAFLLALGFVSMRLGSPYVQSYQFQRLIHDEVESHSVSPHPTALHERIVKIGREMGLNLSGEDVTVEQLQRGFEVRIHYTVPVDLVWYRYSVNFDIVSHPGTGVE